MTLARYYDVLGVSPTADDVVVTAAYRALMRKYHPDVSGAIEAGSKAALINEAYAALREPHAQNATAQPAPASDPARGERRRPGSDRRKGPVQRRGHDRRRGDRRAAPPKTVRRDAEPMVVKVLVLIALLAASSLALGSKAESAASNAPEASAQAAGAPRLR